MGIITFMTLLYEVVFFFPSAHEGVMYTFSYAVGLHYKYALI